MGSFLRIFSWFVVVFSLLVLKASGLQGIAEMPWLQKGSGSIPEQEAGLQEAMAYNGCQVVGATLAK